MTWETETIVSLKTNEVLAYRVNSQTDNLPVEIAFINKEQTDKLVKWLNKKEDWIDRLETIIEHETNIDLDKLKRVEKHD